MRGAYPPPLRQTPASLHEQIGRKPGSYHEKTSTRWASNLPKVRAFMEISELLAPEAVAVSVRAHTKKQLLHDVAGRGSHLSGLPEARVFETLLERERLGSTGMGQGIAIPHGRFGGLSRMVGLFARVEPPVAFDAIDDRPVDLVFALLAPEDAGGDYLKALARISRLLRSHSTCEKLRAATRAEVLYALLTENTKGQGAQAAA